MSLSTIFGGGNQRKHNGVLSTPHLSGNVNKPKSHNPDSQDRLRLNFTVGDEPSKLMIHLNQSYTG